MDAVFEVVQETVSSCAQVLQKFDPENAREIAKQERSNYCLSKPRPQVAKSLSWLWICIAQNACKAFKFCLSVCKYTNIGAITLDFCHTDGLPQFIVGVCEGCVEGTPCNHHCLSVEG